MTYLYKGEYRDFIDDKKGLRRDGEVLFPFSRISNPPRSLRIRLVFAFL